MSSIPREHWAKELKDLDLDRDSLPIDRVLGVQWDVKSDHFLFVYKLQERPPTRRGILSTVSSAYDPLGFSPQSFCRVKFFYRNCAS